MTTKSKQSHTPTSSIETILGALALHQTISGDEVHVLGELKRSHEELLWACKTALRTIPIKDGENDNRQILKQISKLIAKAEGKQCQ